MSSHLHTIHPMSPLSPMSPLQRTELMAEAKARAHALREEALDAAWSGLYRQLAQGLGAVRTALSPQSRTPRKEASHASRIVTQRGQNRTRGPLRLMDP